MYSNKYRYTYIRIYMYRHCSCTMYMYMYIVQMCIMNTHPWWCKCRDLYYTEGRGHRDILPDYIVFPVCHCVCEMCERERHCTMAPTPTSWGLIYPVILCMCTCSEYIHVHVHTHVHDFYHSMCTQSSLSFLYTEQVHWWTSPRNTCRIEETIGRYNCCKFYYMYTHFEFPPSSFFLQNESSGARLVNNV